MTKPTGKQVRPHWTLAQRLAFRTAPPNERGCAIWTGAKGGQLGHGHMRWEGKTQAAHRLAWIAAHGPIPDGLFVCHRCDVPACINVGHLFLGTPQDNTTDMMVKGRNRQPKGAAVSNAKLTDAIVLAILADARPQKTIATEFGVTQANVSSIKRRLTWRHLG